MGWVKKNGIFHPWIVIRCFLKSVNYNYISYQYIRVTNEVKTLKVNQKFLGPKSREIHKFL